MTITVPLTAEEEAKLLAIAERRGVSPGAFLKGVVKDILERSQIASSEHVQPGEQEKRLEELFAAFDGAATPPGVREEAFHRRNWYP